MIEGFTDVLQKFFDSRMENIHTCIPGRIESYEGHSSRKASIKPLVRLKTESGEDVDLPVINDVPVIFPSSQQFQILYPLQKNDSCLLFFTETGIGNYLAGTGQEVNADDKSRFSLTDAVAVPGLWTFKNAPTNTNSIELADTGDLVITVNGKTMTITAAGQINMLTGIESFVKGDTLFTLLNTFLSALSAGIVPATPPNPIANQASLVAIKSAAAALQAGLPTMKSLTIKGE